jgi:hypothetical protein
MKLSEIAHCWASEKPLYLNQTTQTNGIVTPRRFRIYGCKLAKGGKVAVRISRDSTESKWEIVDRAEIVCAY